MPNQQTNKIELQMFVQQVLNTHPQATRVFVDHKMACVGCPMAPFETLEEVANNYDKDPKTFLETIENCRLQQAEK